VSPSFRAGSPLGSLALTSNWIWRQPKRGHRRETAPPASSRTRHASQAPAAPPVSLPLSVRDYSSAPPVAPPVEQKVPRKRATSPRRTSCRCQIIGHTARPDRRNAVRVEDPRRPTTLCCIPSRSPPDGIARRHDLAIIGYGSPGELPPTSPETVRPRWHPVRSGASPEFRQAAPRGPDGGSTPGATIIHLAPQLSCGRGDPADRYHKHDWAPGIEVRPEEYQRRQRVQEGQSRRERNPVAITRRRATDVHGRR
jgi:hypothetical protein